MAVKAPKDMQVGSRHKTNSNGELDIMAWNGSHKVHIRFIETGYESIIQSSDIRGGWVKDLLRPMIYGVGFLGGTELTSKNSRKAYDAWTNMLGRCYNEKSRGRYPTYKGVSVCSEWHNFQEFALWHNEHWIDGFHMDKDLKIKGNKVYSPDACTFISHADNNIAAKAKSYMMISPDGVETDIYNMTKFCRDKGLNQSAMNSVARGGKPQYKGWTLNG